MEPMIALPFHPPTPTPSGSSRPTWPTMLRQVDEDAVRQLELKTAPPPDGENCQRPIPHRSRRHRRMLRRYLSEPGPGGGNLEGRPIGSDAFGCPVIPRLHAHQPGAHEERYIASLMAAGPPSAPASAAPASARATCPPTGPSPSATPPGTSPTGRAQAQRRPGVLRGPDGRPQHRRHRPQRRRTHRRH